MNVAERLNGPRVWPPTKSYVFVDHLPKSNYGKVLKTALRAGWRRRTGASAQ